MAELNANLLFNPNLASIALQGQQMRMQQQQQLIDNAGAIAKGLKTYGIENDFKNAYKNNFNTETNELNQKGVISDLFKTQPQIAAELNSKMQAQEVAGLKARGDYAKDMAEVDNKKIDTYGKSLTQLGNMINAIDPKNPNAQAQMDRTIAFAKKNNIQGVELFEGQPFSEELLKTARGYVIDAKSQADQDLRGMEAKNSADRNLISIRGQDNQAKIATLNRDEAKIKYESERAIKNDEYNSKMELENVKQNQEIDDKVGMLNNSKSSIVNYNNDVSTLQARLDKLNNGMMPRAVLYTQSMIPGTDAYEAKALYDQVLSATNFNTISSAKAQGGGLGGATSDKDMAAAGATKGLIGQNPFSIDGAEMSKRLQTIQQGNQALIEHFDKSVNKYQNETKNKINKATAPRGQKQTADDPVVFTAPNGVNITQSQYEEMKRIRAQQMQR